MAAGREEVESSVSQVRAVAPATNVLDAARPFYEKEDIHS